MAENVNQPRIVVGFDDSEPAMQALRWAVRQAELIGASVEVMLAWHVPRADGWAPTFEVADDLTKAGQRAVAEAIAAAAGDRPEVPIHAHVVEGNPVSALLAAAEGRICWYSAPVDTAASSVHCWAR